MGLRLKLRVLILLMMMTRLKVLILLQEEGLCWYVLTMLMPMLMLRSIPMLMLTKKIPLQPPSRSSCSCSYSPKA